MNRRHRTFLPLPTLVRIGLALSLAFGLGCNSAEISVPPPIDAGPPCSSLPTLYKLCDAGPQASVGMCVAAANSSDPNVARIPSGSYPVGCQVQFYFTDLAAGGTCAPAPNECTCLPNDAGATDDGGPLPGHWSDCADAGLTPVQ